MSSKPRLPGVRSAEAEADRDRDRPGCHGGDGSAIDPRLLVWLSTSFPVGSFAYSHGLELAADRGWISDRGSLQNWLADLVGRGALRNDLILMSAAWRAAAQGDGTTLRALNELALALQPSAERHLETVTQGRAFLDIVTAAWPCDGLAAAATALMPDAAYPVAVGSMAGLHAIPLAGTLHASAIAFVQNLVSAAIRLSVVGQTDAQRVIAAVMPDLEAAARAGRDATLDDLGSTTLRSDLASLAHETQYSRLFRS